MQLSKKCGMNVRPDLTSASNVDGGQYNRTTARSWTCCSARWSRSLQRLEGHQKMRMYGSTADVEPLLSPSWSRREAHSQRTGSRGPLIGSAIANGILSHGSQPCWNSDRGNGSSNNSCSNKPKSRLYRPASPLKRGWFAGVALEHHLHGTMTVSTAVHSH